MDIKVVVIGEPDINALPTDERNIFFETLLDNIEKLLRNNNRPVNMPELAKADD